jgi:hypothetical protein
VTLVIKDYWDAPRPRFELISLDLSASTPNDQQLTIDPLLDARIRNHGYFPNLDLAPKLKDVVEAVDKAKESNVLFERTLAHCDDLIQLVQTQSAARDKAQRRKDFLTKLVARDQEFKILERGMKFATDSFPLPRQYSSHPPNERNVRVDTGVSIFTLAELNPEAEASRAAAGSSDVNTYSTVLNDATRTNLFRRIVVYYEPDILIGFLEQVRKDLDRTRSEAMAIIAVLDPMVAAAREERITAEVLISNNGTKPLALRSEGLLRLNIPNQQGASASSVPVPLKAAGATEEINIVDGGKATILSFSSRDTLRAIIQGSPELLGGPNWSTGGSLDASRLVMLWKAATPALTASIALARAGAAPTDSKAGESPSTIVGVSTVTALYQQLQK